MIKQYFKTLYYADFPANNSSSKSITIAFNNEEYSYFQKIKNMSNQEIRELVSIENYMKLLDIANKEERSINNIIKRQIKQNILLRDEITSSYGTFSNSKIMPFQRWYPYIEGYSTDYVKSLIQKYLSHEVKILYDPFIGTGTTIFGADDFNIHTVYSEINPLLQFIIDTKVTILKLSNKDRARISNNLKDIVNNIHKIFKEYIINKELDITYKSIFSGSIYFDEITYIKILKIRSFIDDLTLTDELLGKIITIAMLSSLIPVSFLKKQGDVRFKTQVEIEHEKLDFTEYIKKKLIEMSDDINNYEYTLNDSPDFLISNAKNIGVVNNLCIDAIITSPPYLNGTNYFRNTKLELWFLRYIKTSDDLRFFRDQALTSGINDVNGSKILDKEILEESSILKDAYNLLQKSAYDKRIPVMANHYFSEMYLTFFDMFSLLNKNARIIIDIGDSIFAGIHIPTDDILIELFSKRYNLIDRKEIRKRRSKNKMLLRQSLLVFEKRSVKSIKIKDKNYYGKLLWEKFKKELPQKKLPYSKKNWGHPNHSLCSYQGKLKPSIAYHLINIFVPKNGRILDPFSGVGTIPFEAALNGIKSYGIDISIPAYYISTAKVIKNDKKICKKYMEKMKNYIINNICSVDELEEVKNFGFNKKLSEYYEKNTLKEIILARRFLKINIPKNSSEMLVVSALLHILHGNRPYALSRQSHPIIPYAPKGDFIYKNLIEKLNEKLEKTINIDIPDNFVDGKIFNQDSTDIWPQEINNLDAVITSPPFFDSTRFYLANWIRIWFSGWGQEDFKHKTNLFIEEKQKKDFLVYKNIFRQARERLKKNGVLILHLGKSKKCNMAEELQKISKYWFTKADLFIENVEDCDSFGIRDKGTVTSHQYLVLI
jgi:tRNA G10  N-methylase Trm11